MPRPHRHLTARLLASQVSVHLASFTLGSADLSKQAATVPCMTPELNLARMRVLEYFNAQSVSGKQPIFTWENGPTLSVATMLWLERSCAPRALPKDYSSKQGYLVSDTELLIKNFPEFECFRDVAFYCKFFLNKDIKAFPSGKELTQKDARLQFQSVEAHPNTFLVRGFGTILHCKPMLRAASPGSEQQLPPTARFGCSSAPGLYAFPHLLETEDDVHHRFADVVCLGQVQIPHRVGGTKCVQVLVVFARYDCFAILCVDGERGRAGAGRPRPGRSGRGRVRLRGTAYLGGGEPEM